ncbi:MAG: hypothetical protein ACM3U1_10180 [Chloroflexota bacterium]
MKLFAAITAVIITVYGYARAEPRATAFSECAGLREASPVAREQFERNYAAVYALPLRWQIAGLNAGGAALNYMVGRSFALQTAFEGTFAEGIFSDYSARGALAWDAQTGFRLAGEIETRTSVIENYGSETIVTANLAAAIELTESLSFSTLVTNLNRAYFKGGERRARQTSAFAAAYHASEEFAIEAESVIEIDGKTLGRAGAYWRAAEFLALRGVYATDGGLRLGAELNPWENLTIELNMERRPRLGVGSGVLVAYAWR